MSKHDLSRVLHIKIEFSFLHLLAYQSHHNQNIFKSIHSVYPAYYFAGHTAETLCSHVYISRCWFKQVQGLKRDDKANKYKQYSLYHSWRQCIDLCTSPPPSNWGWFPAGCECVGIRILQTAWEIGEQRSGGARVKTMTVVMCTWHHKGSSPLHCVVTHLPHLRIYIAIKHDKKYKKQNKFMNCQPESCWKNRILPTLGVILECQDSTLISFKASN